MDQKRLRQKAVALQYNPEEHAPKVIARGAGVVAEKILDKAEEAEITVYQDAKLVEELTRTDIGEHIPPELYEVVAQVLIFINELDKSQGGIEQEIGLERLQPILAEDV